MTSVLAPPSVHVRAGQYDNAWCRRRLDRWDVPPIVGLLLLIVSVHSWNITGYPGMAGNDDEGTYLSQAWAVRNGLGLSHYTYWYDHPPLGWIQIAGLSWLPEVLRPEMPAVAVGRLTMVAFTAASVVLLYVVARRFGFARITAALAVLLSTLSPIALTMQRQIFLDNVAVTWILAAFALALSPRTHLWSHVGAGVCAGIAVLSKETMLLVLPALLFTLWQNAHPSTRSFSVVGFFGCGVGLVGATYPVLAVLKGELLPGEEHVSLTEGIAFQLISRKGSGSVFDGSSDAHGVLQTWVDLDPLFLAIGTVSVLACLAIRRLRGLALAGTLIMAVALRPSGYLPAMYIIQALPFFALCTAGVVDCLLKSACGRRGAAKAFGAIGLCALAVVGSVWLAPRWLDAGHLAVTASENNAFAAVKQWFRDNVDDPAKTRVLVDDNLWLDLVDIGFVPATGAIWYNKIDLDPEIAATAPRGWRDIDFLVSTPGLRRALESDENLPTVSAFVENSRVVATFGSGTDNIEIRQAVGDRW